MQKPIKSKIYILFFIFLAIILNENIVFAQEINKDTQLICYPWMCNEINFIQYHKSEAIRPFFEKWSAKNSPRITIAHFGDSHVQPDIYPGELRKRLQEIKGKAGFGMIFPFSTAKTYSMIDYVSTHTGNWVSSKSIQWAPKLPLGVSGATSQTIESNASFTIKFRDSVPSNYRKLKFFCKQDKFSYDFIIKIAGLEIPVKVDQPEKLPALPFIEVDLPEISNTITIQLVKNNAAEKHFEFYGMSLESAEDCGALLHCLGIGGAQYSSILHQVLIEDQLPSINPDLAILDFGTNDYLYDNKIPADLESQIIKVIEKIRRNAPGCTALLTSTMDMNLRGKNISAGEQFAMLIKKIAKEQNCPFYDWYWVSGGPQKMRLWLDNGLAQKDMVHLNKKGYTIKGQLLADALFKTMNYWSAEGNPDSLIFSTDSIKNTQDYIQYFKPKTIVVFAKKQRKKSLAVKKDKTNLLQYKVKSGDTLSSISRKYKISVNQIQLQNNLQTTKINAGQILKIKANN